MVEDLQSEGSDEDDSSSGEENTIKANPGRESRCVSSTGSPVQGFTDRWGWAGSSGLSRLSFSSRPCWHPPL